MFNRLSSQRRNEQAQILDDIAIPQVADHAYLDPSLPLRAGSSSEMARSCRTPPAVEILDRFRSMHKSVTVITSEWVRACNITTTASVGAA
jgi:hypothetical protein